MNRFHRTNKQPGISPSIEAVSPFGLTALAAVLHVAVFTGRLPVQAFPSRTTTHITWQEPISSSIGDVRNADKIPSNPIHTYCAGHLALILGMAVIALTAWLQIMRISGALGR